MPKSGKSFPPRTAEFDVERALVRVIAPDVDGRVAGSLGPGSEFYRERGGCAEWQVGGLRSADDEVLGVGTVFPDLEIDETSGSEAEDGKSSGLARAAYLGRAESLFGGPVNQSGSRRLLDGDFRVRGNGNRRLALPFWCGEPRAACDEIHFETT